MVCAVYGREHVRNSARKPGGMYCCIDGKARRFTIWYVGTAALFFLSRFSLLRGCSTTCAVVSLPHGLARRDIFSRFRFDARPSPITSSSTTLALGPHFPCYNAPQATWQWPSSHDFGGQIIRVGGMSPAARCKV